MPLCSKTHDLTADPDHADEFETWRSRLVDYPDGRPEGFSDGDSPHTVDPEAAR